MRVEKDFIDWRDEVTEEGRAEVDDSVGGDEDGGDGGFGV